MHGIFNEASDLIFIINAVFKSLLYLWFVSASNQLNYLVFDLLLDPSRAFEVAGLLNNELYRASLSVLSHKSLVVVVEGVIRNSKHRIVALVRDEAPEDPQVLDEQTAEGKTGGDQIVPRLVALIGITKNF